MSNHIVVWFVNFMKIPDEEYEVLFLTLNLKL